MIRTTKIWGGAWLTVFSYIVQSEVMIVTAWMAQLGPEGWAKVRVWDFQFCALLLAMTGDATTAFRSLMNNDVAKARARSNMTDNQPQQNP